MGITQELSELVKSKKEEKEQREKEKIKLISLTCNICGKIQVKVGKDFEKWEEDIFNNHHKHTIKRFFKKLFK